MSERRESPFDRVERRPDRRSPPVRVPEVDEAIGSVSSVSSSGDARPTGAWTVECSGCAERTVMTLRQVVLAAIPSVHLPLLRPGYESWMRCPACRRRTWVRLRPHG